MDTLIGSSEQAVNHIKVCARCGLRYDWRKSLSSMKMTYCCSLCERADLGFTVEALLKFKPAPKPREEEPAEAGAAK